MTRTIIILLALAACTQHARLQDGTVIYPPGGWTSWCQRNPSDPSC